MRACILLTWALAATVMAGSLSACGATAQPPAAPVKLTLSTPADGARVSSSTATVAGVVSPRNAHVLVLGRTVRPDASGGFSATVRVAPGTNMVDVIASAPRARPAMTAIRIVRYVLTLVPDVTGESQKDAVAALRADGLTAAVQGDSNPFAFLIPIHKQVCGQSPGGGARVQPGSTVTISIGQVC